MLNQAGNLQGNLSSRLNTLLRPVVSTMMPGV